MLHVEEEIRVFVTKVDGLTSTCSLAFGPRQTVYCLAFTFSSLVGLFSHFRFFFVVVAFGSSVFTFGVSVASNVVGVVVSLVALVLSSLRCCFFGYFAFHRRSTVLRSHPCFYLAFLPLRSAYVCVSWCRSLSCLLAAA